MVERRGLLQWAIMHDAAPAGMDDLKDLISELRADRQATRDREHKERWTRYTSITVVVVAVLTAFASLWVGRYSTRTLAALNDATYYQVKASDEWSYYQAKSIKQNLYEVTRDQTQALLPKVGSAEAQLVIDINAKVARYESERQTIKQKAEHLEAQRDASRAQATIAAGKGAAVQLVVALLQIAIALCSIALLAKQRRLWELGLLVSAGATSYMIYAFLL